MVKKVSQEITFVTEKKSMHKEKANTLHEDIEGEKTKGYYLNILFFILFIL